MAPSASLADLMHDGFHALLLMRHGATPRSAEALAGHMTEFLGEVERKAKRAGLSLDDVWSAKYAFCAALDDIVLRSPFAMRAQWQARPLQLRLFGERDGGAHFLGRLDVLRARGSMHVDALEVFHLCLLLGFQGPDPVREPGALHQLTLTLGRDIAAMRGTGGGFAPHAARPDHVINTLRGDLPLWMLSGACLLAAAGALAWAHLPAAPAPEVAFQAQQPLSPARP